MHNHSSQPHQNEPKNSGSNMCMVENREMENFSQLDQSTVASHVWETCKPGGSFMCKAPTVSARRVQLMRVYLQSDSKAAEPEPPENEDENCKVPPRSSVCLCGAPKTDNLSKIKSFLPQASSHSANREDTDDGDEDFENDCDDED